MVVRNFWVRLMVGYLGTNKFRLMVSQDIKRPICLCYWLVRIFTNQEPKAMVPNQ